MTKAVRSPDISSRKVHLRTRLVEWLIGLSIMVLLLSGFGVALLENRNVLSSQEQQLAGQVSTYALNLGTIQRANAFTTIARIAGISGSYLVPYNSTGNLLLGMTLGSFTSSLPSGLSPGSFPPSQILANQPITGVSGTTVYSAMSTSDSIIFTSCPSGYRFAVRLDRCIAIATTNKSAKVVMPASSCSSCQGILVILTSKLDTSTRIVRYLFFTALIAVVVAFLLSIWISRNLAKSLTLISDTTTKIAHGRLESRVPINHMDYAETESLARSINAMAHELGAAKDSEHNFLLSISHDLRTPLTSIRGYSDAIIEGVISDPSQAASVISEESKRLERLVADLLDLAKLDTRSFSMNLVQVDLREIVAKAVQSFYPIYRDANLTLELSNEELPRVQVTGDSDRLLQVLGNLVENSYKFAKSHVKVSIVLDSTNTCSLQIQDDGPGIPKKDLPYIFERLYQSYQKPARKLGSGLGLAIVVQLVEAMGHQIRVDSPTDLDTGTRFTIDFQNAIVT